MMISPHSDSVGTGTVGESHQASHGIVVSVEAVAQLVRRGDAPSRCVVGVRQVLAVRVDDARQAVVGIGLASDGEQALQVMAETLPELVILDIMMPKLDGFEVCRRIREWSQVPIIMLSASHNALQHYIMPL